MATDSGDTKLFTAPAAAAAEAAAAVSAAAGGCGFGGGGSRGDIPASDMLRIVLHGAFGLKNHDVLSKQDPYAITYVGNSESGRRLKTRTHRGGGKNPVWEAAFDDVPVDEDAAELLIEIWDNDFGVTSDDFVGAATLSLRCVREAPGQRCDRLKAPVMLRGKHRGDVELSLAFKPGDAVPPPLALGPQRVGGGDAALGVLFPGKLTFELEYGVGLSKVDYVGKQRPYCNISVGSQVASSSKKSGTEPVWNERFEFEASDELCAVIEVMEEDTGRDDWLGTVHVDLSVVRTLGADRVRLPIIDKDSERHGMLQLSLKFDVDAGAPGRTLPFRIDAGFDGGNVQVLSIGDDCTAQLRIRPDPYCETDKRCHFQWFNYKVHGAAGKQVTMVLTNAGQASYPDAWFEIEPYSAVMSYDQKEWLRVPTDFDGKTGELSIRHMPERDAVQYAFFAPFTQEMHRQLLVAVVGAPGSKTKHEVLCKSLDGRDVDLLTVGCAGPGKKSIWVIARQHPAETPGAFAVRGLLDRLTRCPRDAPVDALMDGAVFYVVPCVNPDGAARGHLRTNASGNNLNRIWDVATEEATPEVYHLQRHMRATGVDLLIDCHADETLPYNFVSGIQGRIDGRLRGVLQDFRDAFKEATPHFQDVYGYVRNYQGHGKHLVDKFIMKAESFAQTGVAEVFVGRTHGCLAVTLEQPNKDDANHPDAKHGWSPDAAGALGAAMLDAVLAVLPRLEHQDFD